MFRRLGHSEGAGPDRGRENEEATREEAVGGDGTFNYCRKTRICTSRSACTCTFSGTCTCTERSHVTRLTLIKEEGSSGGGRQPRQWQKHVAHLHIRRAVRVWSIVWWRDDFPSALPATCTGTPFDQNKMDYRFADTPGLADIKMAEQAAAEITKALNETANNGHVLKLYFVTTTVAGRIQSNDLYTIKLVLDSIRLANGQPIQYCVLINKCTFLNSKEFLEGGKQKILHTFMTPSKSVPYPTDNIVFLPFHDKLQDADNASAEFPELVQHIMSFPGMPTIASADKIDVSNLETKLAQAKDLHKKEMDEREAHWKAHHEMRASR